MRQSDRDDQHGHRLSNDRQSRGIRARGDLDATDGMVAVLIGPMNCIDRSRHARRLCMSSNFQRLGRPLMGCLRHQRVNDRLGWAVLGASAPGHTSCRSQVAICSYRVKLNRVFWRALMAHYPYWSTMNLTTSLQAFDWLDIQLAATEKGPLL